MAITMENYGITWTDAEGRPHAAATAYDERSAQQRRDRLEADGCTNVEILKVKPGELPTVP
ncbi:hypothetical protein ACOKM5_43865 [Streptomyces sp. BH097]|uniref:hypothetical protein n=1 Tax=unclassified Streptomyces TaxID=2593676 RepID=UPI003BB4F490